MAWKYVGDGAWLPGIPARDMTNEEMREAKRIEPGVDKCGLYERVPDLPLEAPAPKGKAKGEEGSD